MTMTGQTDRGAPPPGSLDEFVQRAEGRYAERHKERLERDHLGRFVAIDVDTGEAYLGDFSRDALQAAREAAPHGAFHPMRLGLPTAFSSSGRTSSLADAGLLQMTRVISKNVEGFRYRPGLSDTGLEHTRNISLNWEP